MEENLGFCHVALFHSSFRQEELETMFSCCSIPYRVVSFTAGPMRMVKAGWMPFFIRFRIKNTSYIVKKG